MPASFTNELQVIIFYLPFAVGNICIGATNCHLGSFPMNPYARLFVGWTVDVKSACHKFLKRRKVKLPCCDRSSSFNCVGKSHCMTVLDTLWEKNTSAGLL